MVKKAVINAETHNGTKYREEVTVVFSALNRTSRSHPHQGPWNFGEEWSHKKM